MKNYSAGTNSNLGLQILWAKELFYDEGADPDGQRPRHVRAGSGLASFGTKLVGVQDDADFLAFIDPDGMSVRGSALEAGSASHRLYDDRDETRRQEHTLIPSGRVRAMIVPCTSRGLTPPPRNIVVP